MSRLLIEKADFVVGEKILKNASIYIEEGKIVWVGKGDLPTGIEKIDARKCVVLPALVNAHTHLPETVLRGICDDKDLQKWLNQYIWPAENKLTPKDAEVAALLGCAELIHNGIGFFIDQYFYANEIAKSVVKSGIKAILCPSVFDNCPEGKTIEKQFRIAKNFVEEWLGRHERVFVGIGPHAPYTVSDEYLSAVAEFSREKNIHVHIHLSETATENKESLRKFGESPTARLHRTGILTDRTLLAHCVHLSKRDGELIAKAKATILHCPQSNLKLSSGIAKIEELRQRINVLIGTDGNASNNNLDVIEELRTACMLQKFLFGPEAMPLLEAFKMVSSNASLLGCNYKGLIAPGFPGDLAVLPLWKTHLQPVHDVLSNIIYSANGTDVRDLIVDGKIVMENYKILTFDESKVINEAQKIGERLVEKHAVEG